MWLRTGCDFLILQFADAIELHHFVSLPLIEKLRSAVSHFIDQKRDHFILSTHPRKAERLLNSPTRLAVRMIRIHWIWESADGAEVAQHLNPPFPAGVAQRDVSARAVLHQVPKNGSESGLRCPSGNIVEATVAHEAWRFGDTDPSAGF
eukprot:m.67466 g.67466  ORF g.67466 m.67466 type:complete len:149 (-) comp9867_c0_seq1:465-911(-)